MLELDKRHSSCPNPIWLHTYYDYFSMSSQYLDIWIHLNIFTQIYLYSEYWPDIFRYSFVLYFINWIYSDIHSPTVWSAEYLRILVWLILTQPNIVRSYFTKSIDWISIKMFEGNVQRCNALVDFFWFIELDFRSLKIFRYLFGKL